MAVNEEPQDAAEPKPSVSRRTMFKAGAGVAGAVAITGGSMRSAFAASGPRPDQNGGAPGRSADAAPSGSAQALPPHLPGAKLAQKGWGSFRASALDGDPFTMYGLYGLVYDRSGSWVETELELPTGAHLARIDVFGSLTNDGNQRWTVFSQEIGTSDVPLTDLGEIFTTDGPGIVTGVANMSGSPHHIAPGEIVNVSLQASSADSAANGIVYQYYEPGGVVLLDQPIRVYDSRPGNAPATPPKTPLTSDVARTVDCTPAVPAGATGVILNITVNRTGPGGWVVAWPAGETQPPTSTVNWNAPGDTVANGAIVGLNADGEIQVLTNTTTDVIIDVTGYIA